MSFEQSVTFSFCSLEKEKEKQKQRGVNEIGFRSQTNNGVSQ